MSPDDLIRMALRLVQGPVPTLQKKVYGYQGDLTTLLDQLPLAIAIRTRVTDACDITTIPAQVERIAAYLRERLTAHFRRLQQGRETCIILVQEAVLLAQYRVPLSFLYDLTGDAYAVILHLEEEFRPIAWRFPSYVHYNPEAAASDFEQALGDQFIRQDRGEEERPWRSRNFTRSSG